MSVRTPEWLEQRHVAMARKLANCRRALRQLQRAHLLNMKAHELSIHRSMQTWDRLQETTKEREEWRRKAEGTPTQAWSIRAALIVGFVMGAVIGWLVIP